MKSRTKAVTLDCYGTLIDWEAGLRETLAGLLPAGHPGRSDRQALFVEWERLQLELIQGPYRSYREIMAGATKQLLEQLGVPTDGVDLGAPAASIKRWVPFPDVPKALERLRKRYSLAVISNMDDDLLRGTVLRMGVPIDLLVSAERARAYKPAPRPFELALERLGVPATQVLHAAFGFRYDLGPARALGFRTTWVNRGAAPLPDGFQADFEVPGLTELCELLAV